MTPLATLFRARRDWVVVPAAVMISLGLSVLYLSVAPRTYVATANVFVSMQSSDAATTYMRGAFSTIRAQSYTALATSPGVLRRAIDSASPGYPVERLAREVTATILPQTVVLQIAVSSTDPERASRFAEAVSEAVAGRGTELEQAGSRNDAPISLTPLQDVQVSTVPVSPNVPRILTLSVLLGLLAGSTTLSGLRARLAMNGSESGTGDIPDLAVLARIDRHTSMGHSIDERVREQFRILSTNLAFTALHEDLPVLFVTSPNPREGRTSTALGLATAMADGHRRVLLLDGDLRGRSLTRLMASGGKQGLSELIMGSAAPTDCRLSHALGFDFIGSGSPVPNPADLLSSTRPSELLRLLAGSYDQIVVDTPPVRDVADAALWVSHGGSAIVLSRFARTSTISLSDAVQDLRRAGVRLAGAVVTASR